VRGSQRLAVLAIGHESLVYNLVGQGNAAINSSAIAAFRKHPARVTIFAHKIDEEFEGDAGPFIGAHQTMRVLDGQVGVGLLPVLPSVAGAFDEDHARERRHRLKIVDAEDKRLLHHAVDQEPVFCGIELGNTGMAALVMQVGGRDAADQILMRRFGIDCIARIDVSLPRTGFGNAIDLDEFRSFAVGA
jgi:hypothetical protein